MHVQRGPSRVTTNGRHLCGASRSGPVPWKLDWRASARSVAPPRSRSLAVGRGESPQGSIAARRCVDDASGVSGDPGLCSWIARVAGIGGCVQRGSAEAGHEGRADDDRRSGSTRHVARDGAAGGGDPWGSFVGALGVKTHRPRESATESVRGGTLTFSPGRQRREEGALSGEHREELSRAGQILEPRETEGFGRLR